MRLYSAYMFDEYGDVDSDYVFVNLLAREPPGSASALPGRARADRRLRAGEGDQLHRPHAAPLRGNRHAPREATVEVVAKMLTHRSSVTTSQTYGHLDTADLRAELRRSRAWPSETPP